MLINLGPSYHLVEEILQQQHPTDGLDNANFTTRLHLTDKVT